MGSFFLKTEARYSKKRKEIFFKLIQEDIYAVIGYLLQKAIVPVLYHAYKYHL